METTQVQNEATGIFYHLRIRDHIRWIDKKQEWAKLSDEGEEEQQQNAGKQEGIKRAKVKKPKTDKPQPAKKAAVHCYPNSINKFL